MSKSDGMVLVDGSSYLFRAYHALPNLTNSKGLNTGAIKGVIGMVRRLVVDYPNEQVVIVFDARGPTFRNELYPDYKANRPQMPNELREQIEPIFSIIGAMGLPLVCIGGVEADDVIGTLAVEASSRGQFVVISTSDKDMAQLVDTHITLVNTMTDTVLNREGVEKKFGVPPERIIDFLALMGDSADNIPGVPGVGEKTALALLKGIGGLREIYSQLDRVAELNIRGAKNLGEKLAKNREYAELSYQLATIKTDCQLGLTSTQLTTSPPDREVLERLFRELEFRSWLEEQLALKPKVSSVEAAATADLALSVDVITTLEMLDNWIEKICSNRLVAIDTETTSLNYMKAELVGLSFAVKPGAAAYIPVAHKGCDLGEQLPRSEVLMKLRPFFECETYPKVGQHLKYDANVLANYGITLQGIVNDTMLASYVLDSTGTRHDMGSLALKYLGHRVISYEEVAGKGSKQITFDRVDLDIASKYAAEDAEVTLRLHQTLSSRLRKFPALQKLNDELEVPLIPILSRIERNGALVNPELLKDFSEELGARISQLEAKAFELAGRVFNLSSPKQLAEILFTSQGLPVLKKTPKGAPSTAEDVLTELALEYELPSVLMSYRSLSKLKSTYTDRLPEMIDSVTGRVHTSYHQAVTATGRLSSSDPNLQNIPIRTEDGRRIRQAFVAPKSFHIVAVDYSQIELRIMAHLSKDVALTRAFLEGVDVHRATASEVFDVSLNNVTSEQRRRAKAINFGLIYGMSAFGLAKQLKLERQEAQTYIDRYFERYPRVMQYMRKTRESAHDHGFVETLLGRRLYLPEINDRNKQRQFAAERTAINAPMQGTAADIIKLAMLSVDNWLRLSGVEAKIIMQVHDELVFEVHETAVAEVLDNVPRLMSSALTLSVPLVVDIGVGKSWDEAH